MKKLMNLNPAQNLFRTLVCALILGGFSATNANAQCMSGSMDGIITPTGTFQTVSVPAGSPSYFSFTAVAGGNYTFTYCSDGGVHPYDTYLTITDNTPSSLVACDDYCGLGSYLNWTAPATGVYRLYTSACCPCNNKPSVATLAYNCTSCSPALNFDGTNDYVQIPNNTINNLASGTIEAWVNPATVVDQPIFTKQHDNVNTFLSLMIGGQSSNAGTEVAGTPGVVYFHVKNGTTPAALQGTKVLNAGEWYHIAATWSPTAASIYIDGVLDATVAGNYSLPDDVDNSINSTIGAWHVASNLPASLYFTGSIDNFRVWNTARTPAQVLSDICYVASPQAGLIANYTFNEGIVNGNNLAISTVADNSGNGKDGTLINMAMNGAGSNFGPEAGFYVPSNPGQIFGPSVVCGLTTASYSVNPVAGAKWYNWTLPVGNSPNVGMFITSGLGTPNITVQVTAGTLNGNVSVTANSCAGASNPSTLAITKKPVPPSSISGPANVCGANTATYSVPTVPGTDYYTWTLPVGLIGNSTTNFINASVAPNFTVGTVKCMAVNACGSVPGASLTIYGKAAPSLISGPTNVCGLNTATFSCNNVPNATAYNWAVPASWALIGQGTAQITATLPANVNNTNYAAYIKVVAVSDCGNSAAKSLTVNYCRSAEDMINAGFGDLDYVSTIHPNPVTTDFTIELSFPGGASAEISSHQLTIEMYDVLGNLVTSEKHVIEKGVSSVTTSLTEFKNGMYFVRVLDADMNVMHTERIIKQ